MTAQDLARAMGLTQAEPCPEPDPPPSHRLVEVYVAHDDPRSVEFYNRWYALAEELGIEIRETHDGFYLIEKERKLVKITRPRTIGHCLCTMRESCGNCRVLAGG